jgi:hypothetical protein
LAQKAQLTQEDERLATVRGAQVFIPDSENSEKALGEPRSKEDQDEHIQWHEQKFKDAAERIKQMFKDDPKVLVTNNEKYWKERGIEDYHAH